MIIDRHAKAIRPCALEDPANAAAKKRKIAARIRTPCGSALQSQGERRWPSARRLIWSRDKFKKRKSKGPGMIFDKLLGFLALFGSEVGA